MFDMWPCLICSGAWIAPRPGGILDSFGFAGPSMAFFGVKGVLEMILSHRAQSSFIMSSYRAIWTHFKSNSVISIDLILQNLFIWTSNFRASVYSTLMKAEDLMPRDIMSSEPRHWMVFGQLVMPVQCCAEARRRRVPQHSTAQAWPTGQIPSSALAKMT